MLCVFVLHHVLATMPVTSFARFPIGVDLLYSNGIVSLATLQHTCL